jgi:hypothetical protein
MDIYEWLLSGDVSCKYLTLKYLNKIDDKDLKDIRDRIEKEGFGLELLKRRNSNKYWGNSFYQPKWISTHYTLLDLRYLEINPTQEILESINKILDECKTNDGSINESTREKNGDVCVNGMFLNYASFFKIGEEKLISIVDFIINSVMSDGGFNCDIIKHKPVHSSMHSTLSVLEGINEFIKAGYTYRINELQEIKNDAEEFLLDHRLYKSSTSMEIINKDWLKFSFPTRWKYDILRALVYFCDANVEYDYRLQDSIEIVSKKMNKNGTWNVQNKHPGQTHFEMEKVGHPSRFNTIRALRVIDKYEKKFFDSSENSINLLNYN